MPAALDITGQRFHMLTALRRGEDRRYPCGQTRRAWVFRCDCGAEVSKLLRDVRRGDTKSCGCDRSGKPAPTRLSSGEASFRGLLGKYKRAALLRGHAWSIDDDMFRRLTLSNCHYCGAHPAREHLTHRSAYGVYIYNGVDRLDNGIGYEPGNVASCCTACNFAKRDMSEEQFLSMVSRIYAHRIGGVNGSQ